MGPWGVGGDICAVADALTPGKEGRPTGEADGRRGGVAVHVDTNPGELLVRPP